MTGRQSVGAGGLNEPEQLHDALSELLAGLAGAASLAEAGAQLGHFGVRRLGADVAAVSRHGRRRTSDLLAVTDPAAARVAAARATGAEAARTTPLAPGETVLVGEIGADPRAPGWHAVSAELGLRSAHLIGLPALSSGAVVLELYARAPHAFATRSPQTDAQLVRLAGSALRETERRLNLEDALQTRGVIGQAQGVLMERYGLTTDQAMAYLRRHSQQTHLPIRDLASEVVGRRETESQAREHDDLG